MEARILTIHDHRRIQRELKQLLGDDPMILFIRRSTHTDIITNITDVQQRANLAAWVRSVADQIDPSKEIIVPHA